MYFIEDSIILKVTVAKVMDCSLKVSKFKLQ